MCERDRRTVAVLTLLAALGCDAQRQEPPCVRSETMSLSTYLLELEAEDGTVRGVDLDGHATRDSGALEGAGCGREDQPDPDRSLVDNEFASVGVLLGAVHDVDPRTLFAGPSLTLELEQRGDEVCSGLDVSLGAEGPRREAGWNGSTFRAHDIGDIPLRYMPPGFDEAIVLHDAAVRITVDEERVTSVVLAGRFELGPLVVLVQDTVPDIDPALVQTTLEGTADLVPGEDGFCEGVSIAFEMLP